MSRWEKNVSALSATVYQDIMHKTARALEEDDEPQPQLRQCQSPERFGFDEEPRSSSGAGSNSAATVKKMTDQAKDFLAQAKREREEAKAKKLAEKQAKKEKKAEKKAKKDEAAGKQKAIEAGEPKAPEQKKQRSA
eukprot:TRINITY_DN31045_c0_g1_i2.p1 TRINITY_DN31045_c0_g1~~TRINITY_DN31045_c0_g1_i2.p1  ORF type:complete len:136 (-),score=72.37 TRINITY_DN31045_c0_g1_i2:187-594(-)